MTDLKFPDTQSKEWLDLRERATKLVEEFKSIREGYTELYKDFPTTELGGKRQPTIVYKLRNYPGDITPTMFATLIKEVENN
jgi:hypothetical protein